MHLVSFGLCKKAINLAVRNYHPAPKSHCQLETAEHLLPVPSAFSLTNSSAVSSSLSLQTGILHRHYKTSTVTNCYHTWPWNNSQWAHIWELMNWTTKLEHGLQPQLTSWPHFPWFKWCVSVSVHTQSRWLWARCHSAWGKAVHGKSQLPPPPL